MITLKKQLLLRYLFLGLYQRQQLEAIVAGHADIAKAVHVAGTGCTVRGNWFTDNTTDENFLICIQSGTADNDADGLLVEGRVRLGWRGGGSISAA